MNISPTSGTISPTINGTAIKVNTEAKETDSGISRQGTNITLSSQSMRALAQDFSSYSAPERVTRLTFSNSSDISNSLKQFSYSSLNTHNGVSLKGGAQRFSELASSGVNSYEQDIRQYSKFKNPQESTEKQNTINTDGFQELSYDKDAHLNLTLKTKDGDTINFSLQAYTGTGKNADDERAAFKGVKISFEFEGKLSEQEKKQLDAFSQNIDGMVQQLSSSKDFDFNQLDLTSLTSFSDIDIAYKPSQYAARTDTEITLNYKDTQTERSIDVDFLGHTSRLNIDKTSIGMDSEDKQKQDSLNQYLEILKSSAREAHAQDSASRLMESIFETGFKGLGLEESEEQGDDTIDASKLAFNEIETDALKEVHNKTLVPLPDFDFSFDSKIERPNEKNNPEEYEGFKVNLSMKTDIVADAQNYHVTATQTQKFELSGAYYSPIDGFDNPDFGNQNYKYTELDRASEKVTTIKTEQGKLVSAMTSESGENNSTTLEYRMGKLVDIDEDSSRFLESTDFTELANKEFNYQSKELLDTVMIDPFEVNQASEETNTLSITD